MKKFRTILCVAMALVMVLAFTACKAKDSTDTPDTSKTPPSAAPTSGGQDTAQPTETQQVRPSTEPGSDMEYDSRHFIYILSELENRPRKLQPGTEFVYLAGNDVPSQLPWNCASEGWLWCNVYEGLLMTNLGDVTDIRGCVAESWEHSEDFLTWTFKIRDGVKFHDGTVCDAPAIAKAWEFTQQASAPYITNQNITSWEATDDKTLVVHLSAPCPYFEQAMSNNPLMPVSPTALELYGIGDNRAAIGTGPYKIESYTSGVEIVLKAFPDYYLEDKMPAIETIRYAIVADQNTQVMAILNGDIDCARLSTVEQYYTLQDQGYDGILEKTIGGANPFWLNPKWVPIFQTREVRVALDRFIDMNAINDLICDGMGIVDDSIWPTGTPSAVPYDQYYYDPDEGMELLASVGVAPSDIKFHAPIPDFAKQDFEAVQDQLGKAGVEISLEVIEAEANFTLLRNGDWSLQVGSTGYSSTGPYIPWGYILKEGCMIRQCWQEYYNPELYALMLDEYDKMVTASTWDQMIEHCKQLTTYVQEDFGALAGYQKPGFVACSKEYKGLVLTTDNLFIQMYLLYT